MKPLLSIIIANYNYGRFLSEAIESIISQELADEVEIIVCDAASTDHSVDVIRKYENNIAWWCSEKDGGQSAAFNKGFSHARGRFLTWLNADDVLMPGTIKSLKIAAEKDPGQEWFVGGVMWLDPDMRIVNCGRGRSFSEIRYKEGNVSVWGPSSFFTKRMLDGVGGVDERFHYAMDSDLWLRFAFKLGARYKPFCDYAWGLRLHPEAKMSRHNFNKDGKLVLGDKQVLDEKQAKAERQKALETRMIREYFTPKAKSRLSRILSASWMNVLLARYDLWRFKGKHYKDYFI